MKQKTVKQIPQPIQNFILEKFNSPGEANRKPGEHGFIKPLTKSVNGFLLKNKSVFPNLFSAFNGNVSFDKISRAFDKKSPHGAGKDLRDLLCYYATDSAFNWNETLKHHFSEHANLTDVKKEVNGESGKSVSLTDVYQILEELKKSQELKPELRIVEKQIESEKSQLRDAAEQIGKFIIIYPNQPEFPPERFYQPRFPATETFQIQVEGFKNVWIKDESINPTGTHKDRMAWEITKNAEKYNLSEISIISSGSAAIAIRHYFNLYDIKANLKVLVDKNLKPEIKEAMKRIGCEIHETNLAAKALRPNQIREKTANINGIDITYRETMDIHNTKYYNWMSYEILNSNPDYCFIPFGTGDLFANILNIVHTEYNARKFVHDFRFKGDINRIIHCNYLGATTRNSDSKMDKLFSYHLPSMKKHKDFISDLKSYGCIGSRSNIYAVQEKFIDDALNIASREKINCEPSGIAGLALLLQRKNEIPRDKKILIINTGSTNLYPVQPTGRRHL